MATAKDKCIIPPPSLPQLHTALTSLQTATYILAGLNHRNKNQHRGTKWWPAFSMLRRSLQKLILDLEAAIQRAEVMAASNAKQRKQPRIAIVKAAKQPELDRVVERAVWMREVLGPRAYEAFSQLTADRQFAQLGLVLVGVLAQIEAAMAHFVPAEPSKPPQEEKSGLVRAMHGSDASKSVNDAGELDLGVVVSREELDDSDNMQPSVQRSPSPIPRLSSTKEQHDPGRTKSNKRKKPKVESSEMVDETETISAASIAAENGRKLQAEEKKPRIAKPATLVDELKESRQSKRPKLDSIPSTTREDESKAIKKKSTKKKKKGGDEFDDLFSSLL